MMSFGLGGGMTPMVKNLIIINFVVWGLQLLSPYVTYWLQFVPAFAIRHPWTAFTYMFTHDPNGIWHILLNMMVLFFFGPPLESRWGSSEFLKYYILCGLGGAALSFFFAWNASIIGASAAVYGVMLAFAMNWPDAPIYIWGIFPVPAKYLVVMFAVVSLYSGIKGVDSGTAHFAHLGGFAAGFIYLKIDKRGGGLFTRVRKMVTRSKMNVTSGGTPDQVGAVGHMRSRGRAAPGGQEAQILSELDRVLDKISTQGMSSLTVEERKLLDEASRRYRQN